MGTNDPWRYLVSLGVHHRTWDDPLFVPGLSVCSPLRKIPCIDLDDEEFFHSRVESKCSVFGCNKRFNTVAEAASHHRTCHSYVCFTCKQSLQSCHLLDLHIQEAHDTFFHLMAAREPMYQCLLETCFEKFNTLAERKTHCMDNHKFPADFRFDPAWRKLGKNRKAGRMNHNEMAMEYEEGFEAATDKRVSENFISGKGVNAFVCNRKTVANKLPNFVSFGLGVPRGFIRGSRGKRGQRREGANHWHQKMSPSNSIKTNIEEVSMKDLEQALCSESDIP